MDKIEALYRSHGGSKVFFDNKTMTLGKLIKQHIQRRKPDQGQFIIYEINTTESYHTSRYLQEFYELDRKDVVSIYYGGLALTKDGELYR